MPAAQHKANERGQPQQCPQAELKTPSVHRAIRPRQSGVAKDGPEPNCAREAASRRHPYLPGYKAPVGGTAPFGHLALSARTQRGAFGAKVGGSNGSQGAETAPGVKFGYPQWPRRFSRSLRGSRGAIRVKRRF
jgi:hypothetical protein